DVPSFGTGGECERESVGRIGPLLEDVEPFAGEHAADRVRTVLVGAFSTNRFSRFHDELEGGGANRDVLATVAHEVHLDARALGVPDRPMRERIEIEVAIELAVEAHEQVAVESRG